MSWRCLSGRARAPVPPRNPSPSVLSASAGGRTRVFPRAGRWRWWRSLSGGSPSFFAILVFFHACEAALLAAFHGRSNVSLGALLISKQHIVDISCALLEYMIEIILFPELKEHMWISNFGLVMVIVGELIRKVAMATARNAFTYTVRTSHEHNHVLITHGIYRFIRHPGYCGYFISATGTQVMLCNPICVAASAVVLWRFFAARIQYEEFYLRQFFGSRYDEYAEQVPSGLPFVR